LYEHYDVANLQMRTSVRSMRVLPESMIKFREVKDSDWQKIAWLASNLVQEADHGDGQESDWIENRLSFNGTRHHHVALKHEHIVGYCSLERSDTVVESGFRVFLVMDWVSRNLQLREALMEKVDGMISSNGIARVWMRELTGDKELIEFVESRGFLKSEPYVIDDKEMVNLSKMYSREL